MINPETRKKPGRPTDRIADPASFGGRVRSRRQRHGLTLAALAEAANLATSTLGDIELGVVDPPLSTCRRIAATLKVRLGRLVD